MLKLNNECGFSGLDRNAHLSRKVIGGGLFAIGGLLLITAALLSLPTWDVALFFWLNTQGARFPLLAQIFTHVADKYWATPLLIILLASRAHLLAAIMASALAVHLCVGAIKHYFAVLRPCFDEHLAGKVFTTGPSLAADIFSFPSGHSATAALLAVTLLAAWGWRALLPAILLALGIAASRSMLGAHYPSDTGAGLVLGLSVGVCSFYLAQYFAFRLHPVQWRRWGSAIVWLIALGLLLRTAFAHLGHHPVWFKWVSLLGCVWAIAVLLQQVYRWRAKKPTRYCDVCVES